MDKLKFKVLPKVWIESYNKLRILTDLSNYKSLKMIGLTIIVTLLEIVSIALMIPLLKLINNDGALIVSEANNTATNKIIMALNFIGLPVTFIFISLIIAIIVLLRQYLNFSLTKFLSKIKADNNRILRKKLFECTFLSKPEIIEDLGHGSYIELMINQSSRGASYLVHIMKYISILLLSFGYFSIALILAPVVTLVGMFIAIIILIFADKIITKIKKITENNIKDLKYFSKYLGECFSSWKVIKLANSYDYENNRNDKWINEIAEQDYQVELNLAKSTLLITVAIMMLLILVLNIGVKINHIELSLLVMFSIMCLRLIPIMLNIVHFQTRITVAAESLNRIFKVINNLKKNEEIDLGNKKISLKNSIVFDNMSFKYPNSESYVFKNLNETIPFGKVTSICGKSGSGKSTLLDIISRIEGSYEGSISIDGISIKNVSLVNFRNNISLLSQNPFIFDDTVISNISYGNVNMSKEDIINAAKLANAHDFIINLAEDYNTILGERGSKLSGGQIQRIVLARILASRAKIIILDEPTSALDESSADKIVDALINIKNTNLYTLIISSHSKKILELGDKLIDIDILN